MLKYLHRNPYLVFICLLTILTLLVRDHVFFWDTVQLSSKHAHWFYENGFCNWILPEEIDSGHPPVFGAYLALLWHIFGKSLFISHMAMLPFLWLICYLIQRIACLFASPEFSVFLLLLVFLDPVVSTQSVLISPDIVLMCFFLLTFLGVFERNSLFILIGIIGLNLVSMRGMMISAGFLLFELFRIYSNKKIGRSLTIQLLSRSISVYVPGFFLAFAFLLYHYVNTGWIAYHEQSPWAPSFEEIDVKGFFRNVGVIVWRFLDFGRLFVWLGIILIVLGYLQKKLILNTKARELANLFFCLCCVLLPSMLFHKALLAHRYLLALFFILNLFVYYYFFGVSIQINKSLRRLFIIIVLGLFAGNLWMYPKSISQGWDATLAHLPYYDLRDEMIAYIEESDIPLSSIGTAFPEIGAFKYKDLTENQDGFVERDLSRSPYILYSNIMNDFTVEEMGILLSNTYTELYHIEERGIVFSLFKRSNEFKK